VLGDLGRILRSRSLGWQGATASVLIERLAGQVALGLVALASLGLWLGAKGLALGGLGLLAVLVALWVAPRLRNLFGRAWLGREVWGRQLGLTVAILAANLGGFWAAAHSVGVVLDPVATVALVPLTLLAMLIPLTINGWGVREGIAAALWPLWGIAAAQAVAASVAFGLACMGAALIGLLPWLWHKRASTMAAPE
jgi:glycosyltransferase 2 family protein